MNYVLSFLIAFVMAGFAMLDTAEAALSNENNPYTIHIPLGSPSSDATVIAGHFGKRTKIKSAKLINGAAIAASDTNYAQVHLKIGSTVIAEIDTRAAHENGLADKVGKSVNISGDGTIASGSDVTVLYDETDAGTNVALTGAVLSLLVYSY